MIEAEMKIPWRACEAMHWQMGEDEMARRAGVKPFSSSSSVALEPPPKHKRGNGNGNGNSAPAHKGNPGCSGTVEAVAPGASETSTGGNGVSKK